MLFTKIVFQVIKLWLWIGAEFDVGVLVYLRPLARFDIFEVSFNQRKNAGVLDQMVAARRRLSE